MSRWINLSDSRGRNARVRMESKRMSPSMCYQAMDGRKATAARIIKAPLSKTYAHLRSRCQDDQELAKLIMEGDPEIDLEAAGRKTGHTERILLDSQNQVLYAASEMEVIFDTNGQEIERRPPVDTPSAAEESSLPTNSFPKSDSSAQGPGGTWKMPIICWPYVAPSITARWISSLRYINKRLNKNRWMYS